MTGSGRIRARLAQNAQDLSRAQALRHLCFHTARGLSSDPGFDMDRFDATSRHVLIEGQGGQLLACYRVTLLPDGRGVPHTYAAQFYDLGRLAAFPAPMLELGRFCIHPEASLDPDVLRMAWGALAGLVDAAAVKMLFGCSSFNGADPRLHADELAFLARHKGPDEWAPAPRAQDIALRAADIAIEAAPALPPLLRTYLSMAGWVSGHAVIDRLLDTLHVFTAVEVARIPPARARVLRALSVPLT